jgi:hypothetical protein
MIVRMVQDCLAEDFNHAAHHRDNLQKELAEIGQLLRTLGEAQRASSSRGIESFDNTNQRKSGGRRKRPSPPHATRKRNGPHKTKMLRMDEIVGQTPLKDLDHIQLVLT